MLKEEEKFGIKVLHLQKFEKKFIKLEKILCNIKKKMKKTIIGCGAPAKTTTTLNFFGI